MPVTVNLTKLYSLLKKTDPVPDEYDVVWHGPYHVPRSRQWNPSHFMLYGGKLFCTLNYLKVAALAYDAAFPKTRDLSAFGKYKRWADTRHGGGCSICHGRTPRPSASGFIPTCSPTDGFPARRRNETTC